MNLDTGKLTAPVKGSSNVVSNPTWHERSIDLRNGDEIWLQIFGVSPSIGALHRDLFINFNGYLLQEDIVQERTGYRNRNLKQSKDAKRITTNRNNSSHCHWRYFKVKEMESSTSWKHAIQQETEKKKLQKLAKRKNTTLLLPVEQLASHCGANGINYSERLKERTGNKR